MSIELVMPSNHLGHLVDGILLWQPGLTDTDREGFVIKSATVHRVTKSQTWLKWLSIHAPLLFLKFHSAHGSWKEQTQQSCSCRGTNSALFNELFLKLTEPGESFRPKCCYHCLDPEFLLPKTLSSAVYVSTVVIWSLMMGLLPEGKPPNLTGTLVG